MAIRAIDDSILQGIAEGIQAKDGGGKMHATEMRGRIDALQVANPDESLIKFFTNTIEYIKINNACVIPKNFDSGSNQKSYYHLVFFSAKNAYNYVEESTFRAAVSLIYANVGLVEKLLYRSFTATYNLRTLILCRTSVVDLTSVNNISDSHINRKTGYVWVYDSLVSDYQSATNWNVYASQIKGFSEAPIFDNSVTYSIGDVCQYNGRFYGYCKRDLTSSTGDPPTGTNEDNDYWEYVADIEVI